MTDNVHRRGAEAQRNAEKIKNGEASGKPSLLRFSLRISAPLRLCGGCLLPLFAAALLAACAGGPPAPDWQAAAHDALAGYRSAYLKGETRAADAEFTRAQQALARTGRADLVARAELTRCAMRTASLDAGNGNGIIDDTNGSRRKKDGNDTGSRAENDARNEGRGGAGEHCPGFTALAGDADDATRAYAAFLAGRAANPTQLPAQYRNLAAGEAALAGIADPLSRLVAAGVLLNSGRLSPTGVDLAVDTASGEGWRRPLLAWLGVQAELAAARGDDEGAARARRRAALVAGER